jgi:hypothetical protein
VERAISVKSFLLAEPVSPLKLSHRAMGTCQRGGNQ